jgi:hypothetical protein
MDNPSISQGSAAAASRVVPIQELSGWLSKTLDVPPASKGVVIRPDGKAETLKAGTHTVLTAADRLAGLGAGLKVGLIPADPFTARVKTPYLLSGDDVLMDAEVTFQVSVVDAPRYFTGQVISQGEMKPGQIDLSGESIQASVAQLVRRYAAADLIHGLPTYTLADSLQQALNTALQDLGLQVDSVQMIAFARSDDRVKVAEKVMKLEQGLQDIELQKKMAAVESQAQLDDFIHQLEPDIEDSIGLRPVLPGKLELNSEKPAGPDPLKAIQGWVQDQTKKTDSGSHWRLTNLFQKKDPEPVMHKTYHSPRNWWVRRAAWIAILWLFGFGVTYWMMTGLKKEMRADILYGFLTGFWLFLLPIIFGEIKKLIEKRELITQAIWNLPSATYLEQIVGRDKARADRLVREQCSFELERSRGMLEDIVSRLYNAGNTDEAIRVRELRHKFETALEKMKQTGFGTPAYLGEIKVSSMAWDRMLDYDDSLLGFSGAISQQVYNAQQAVGKVNGMPGRQSIEQRLDDFLYRFGGRSQVLKNQ